MRLRLTRILSAGWLCVGLATTVQAELSDKIRSQITASVPKFAPRVLDQPAPAIGTPAPLSDDPLVLLPEYQIREKRALIRNPELLLNQRGRQEKALDDYRSGMNSLEWALNSWNIPLPFGFSLTPSAQARANEAYLAKKIKLEHQHLTSFAKTLATLDSAEAKKLLRDLDLTRHPGK